MRNWIIETMIVVGLLGLVASVAYDTIKNPRHHVRVIEIKNIEEIIKAGEFVYNDSKYSIKKTDEKIWASCVGLPIAEENT